MKEFMKRRAIDLLNIIALGDGAATVLAPRPQALAWSGGQKALSRTMQFIARRPAAARCIGLGAIAFGIWLLQRADQRP